MMGFFCISGKRRSPRRHNQERGSQRHELAYDVEINKIKMQFKAK